MQKRFHKVLQLSGTPLRVEFRTGGNPFKEKEKRSSKLTPGQKYRLNKKGKRDS
jgi:hypothetical protein